ncbi:MAG TPA: hypothetical protein VFO95_18325, partial [Gemmatimonadales bacterium]|nr:hypothetical protein [Gemmatimonadales bacterium]
MPRHPFAVSLLAGLAACSSAAGSGTDLVRIAVTEGTSLAFDLSRNDSTIAFDLLGQIWVLPAAGGEARAITDAVRDTAEESHPALSPDGRTVVFAGERAGHAGLWLVDIASGQVRRLTTPPRTDDFPAWSPDGSRIAFIRDVARMEGERVVRFAGLHLIDTAGGEPVLVPLGDSGRTSVRQPAWSADGRKLYVAAPRRGGTAIWEVDLTNRGQREVGDSALSPTVPAPSPDGHTLAFLAPDSAGRTQVWLHDLTTRKTRRLTDHPEITAQSLRWNRDGTALLYVANGRLQRHDLAAGSATEVPFTARLEFARARAALPQRQFAAQGSQPAARGQFGVALSPSGKQIAILALGKLWIVPVGGAPREVAAVPSSARDVAWAPSEQQVAYSVGEWGEEDIVITDVTTGRTHPLTALPAMEVVPRWSPDGRWIAFVRVHPDSGQKLLVVAADAPTLRSLSAAKNLGEPYFSEWAIGLGRSAAPVWRADSRALLVHHLPPSPQSREPFGYVRSTVGEVVPLEGPRRKLAHFPLQPTDEQWIDDTTFVFLQADRIWRARFSPDSGMIGSPAPLNDDPALYLSAARDGSVLYVSGDGLRLRRPSGTVTRLGWPVTYQVPVQPPLVVRNAKVLDGTGAPPTEPRDLLVRSGRIERIAPAGSLDTSDARVVDAEGGIVMPGLADLHFHYDGPSQLRGQLYHGVTLVRDQGSDIGTLAAMAEGGATGAWDAPRISFGGFQVYSDWAFSNGLEQGLEPEQDSAHVSRVVALLTAHGADHMKIRTFHGWTTATRLVQAAHRAGLRTTGHCVLPLALLAAGMDTQEHSGNNCGSRLDAPYRQDLQDLFRATGVSVVPSTIMYTWWGGWVADKRLLEADD